MTSRSENAAHLEMAQLEKTMLQRELENLRGKLSELSSATIRSSGTQESKDEQQKRDKVFDNVNMSIEDVKMRLEMQTLETAKLSQAVEIRQLEVTRSERRLDAIDRLINQVELPQEPPTPAQSTVIPNKIIGDQMVVENFQRAVMQQLQQSERDRVALQAENAELKKKLEKVKEVAPMRQ